MNTLRGLPGRRPWGFGAGSGCTGGVCTWGVRLQLQGLYPSLELDPQTQICTQDSWALPHRRPELGLSQPCLVLCESSWRSYQKQLVPVSRACCLYLGLAWVFLFPQYTLSGIREGQLSVGLENMSNERGEPTERVWSFQKSGQCSSYGPWENYLPSSGVNKCIISMVSKSIKESLGNEKSS